VRSSRPSTIYAHPRLYDIAFGHRDIPAECDGLLAIAGRHGLAAPRHVVELACGPAHHLRELARRGVVGYGVDLSPRMLAYARSMSKREGVALRLVRGDMRSFRLPRKVDFALCLFDSFVHCTTDEDGVALLRSVARALVPKGLLVLELAHPADFFNLPGQKRTLTQWTDRRAKETVRTRFSITRIDPVSETYVARISIETRARPQGRPRRLTDVATHRMWLRSAVNNIVSRSGAFEVVGTYGAMSPTVPLTMDFDSWRMVIALRRTSAR
jgi:SAM-dependent methyltransferase